MKEDRQCSAFLSWRSCWARGLTDVMTNSAIWDLRPTAFWRHLCVDRAKVMYWCSCVCVKSVFRGWPLPLTQLSHLPTPALHMFLSHLPWLQEYSCSSSDRGVYRIDSHQWQCADESCVCGTVAMFFASRARQGQILYARTESQKLRSIWRPQAASTA